MRREKAFLLKEREQALLVCCDLRWIERLRKRVACGLSQLRVRELLVGSGKLEYAEVNRRFDDENDAHSLGIWFSLDFNTIEFSCLSKRAGGLICLSPGKGLTGLLHKAPGAAGCIEIRTPRNLN
jgi:hypothetical protein